MKTLSLLSAIFATLVLMLSSCAAPISSLPPDNNNAYTVDYLFEYDGCKVYRFRDRGNYVYFTNCNGSVTNITSDSTRVETIVRVKK